LIHEDQSEAIKLAGACLDQYQEKFRRDWLNGMRKKLGLFNAEIADLPMVEELLMLMYKHQADYTSTFRNLHHPSELSAGLVGDGGFKNWVTQWNARLSRQSESKQEAQALMDSVNPAVIPRNHLVEEVLESASKGNMAPFHDFLEVLSAPYTEPADKKYLLGADAIYDAAYQTFCGT
jgi:uncharacterized protein YdiU (UPF0061 family)